MKPDGNTSYALCSSTVFFVFMHNTNLGWLVYCYTYRSNAFGVSSVCARIGGIAAPYLIVAQDALSWLPNVVFGICGKFFKIPYQ